jgi:hypothetical protein
LSKSSLRRLRRRNKTVLDGDDNSNCTDDDIEEDAMMSSLKLEGEKDVGMTDCNSKPTIISNGNIHVPNPVSDVSTGRRGEQIQLGDRYIDSSSATSSANVNGVSATSSSDKIITQKNSNNNAQPAIENSSGYFKSKSGVSIRLG